MKHIPSYVLGANDLKVIFQNNELASISYSHGDRNNSESTLGYVLNLM